MVLGFVVRSEELDIGLDTRLIVIYNRDLFIFILFS